jgi:hypothetical protein
MTLGLFDLGFLGGLGAGVALDPDAQAYITAVEAADGQALETAVRAAINDFVVGCKADGIWPAIKASCILAGARTLTGALVPLVGTAPTNVNFVSGDYDRKTGLVGDGSTKYLNSNRAANADPLASSHLSIYKTTTGNSGAYIGSITGGQDYIDHFSTFRLFSRSVGVNPNVALSTTGLLALSRNVNGISTRINNSSGGTSAFPPANAATGNLFVFNRSGGNYFSSARLAFYSIGESLDLALLDARVTALINAIAAAIP